MDKAEKFYLVTGGSGFCGFEIVRYLLKQGHRVRVLDLEPLPEKTDAELVTADIRDYTAVENAVRGTDCVIHCIAKVPISKAGREFWEVNVDGTRNILEAARKNLISKVVHLSSSSVQLSKTNPVPEDAEFHPVGEYAKSKLKGETVCEEFRGLGMNIDIIRPRTVIGAGRLGIFDILFDWISEGRKVYILGSGHNKIQFLHAEDLAICCYLSSLAPGSNTFNVGSKSFQSLRQDLQSLIDEAGTSSRIVSVPVLPSMTALAVLDFLRLSPLASWHYMTYHKDFYFDNANAKKILGWEPRYGNSEILKIAYRDYMEHRAARQNYGSTHRKPLKQGLLKILKWLS